MCTVIYIPHNDKMFFASLRDESPLRPTAINPEIYTKGDITVLSPMDAMAGGTWLGINNQHNIVILLNGGFEKHEHLEPYKKSRGLIVNELLQSSKPIQVWELLDLENIEPFTLMVWSSGSLSHLVWDGVAKHQNSLDITKPHLLSSSSLYDTEAKKKRSLLFHNWMASQPVVNRTSVFDFFNSYKESENGYIMNRNELVKTLSYSFIELTDNEVAELSYSDLHRKSESKKIIKMNSNIQY